MKRFVIGTALALISLQSFAATGVKLDMRLKFNGKSQNSVIKTEYGKSATISQKSSDGEEIEIYALPMVVKQEKPTDPASVRVNIQVTQIKGGVKTVLSRPSIVLALGKRGKISQSAKDGRQVFTLNVTPTEFK